MEHPRPLRVRHLLPVLLVPPLLAQVFDRVRVGLLELRYRYPEAAVRVVDVPAVLRPSVAVRVPVPAVRGRGPLLQESRRDGRGSVGLGVGLRSPVVLVLPFLGHQGPRLPPGKGPEVPEVLPPTPPGRAGACGTHEFAPFDRPRLLRPAPPAHPPTSRRTGARQTPPFAALPGPEGPNP